jgi:hypothetical protein
MLPFFHVCFCIQRWENTIWSDKNLPVMCSVLIIDIRILKKTIKYQEQANGITRVTGVNLNKMWGLNTCPSRFPLLPAYSRSKSGEGGLQPMAAQQKFTPMTRLTIQVKSFPGIS